MHKFKAYAARASSSLLHSPAFYRSLNIEHVCAKSFSAMNIKKQFTTDNGLDSVAQRGSYTGLHKLHQSPS